jgi:sugar/nucleoside kinase (ribokinase family)
VGDDYAGGFVRADLERDGVLVDLQRVPAATAAIAVLFDERGERTMIADRAAATLLTPDFVGRHPFPPGSNLHLPAYSLFVTPLADAALAAVDRCRDGGGRVSVDASSVGPLRAFGRDRFLALLDQIGPDVLLANADEGAFLSGVSDAEQGSLLLQRFAPVVAWKLGAAGAVARGDEYARESGIDVPAIDTTGAGDAFAAAFILSHAEGQPIAVSLRRANRVAAAVVQHIGARPRLALNDD